MTGIDDAISWVKAAEQACSNLEPAHVDLIVASGPPFSAFTWLKNSQNGGRYHSATATAASAA